MKTDLEYKQCEEYYKEIISDLNKKIRELEEELSRVRRALN